MSLLANSIIMAKATQESLSQLLSSNNQKPNKIRRIIACREGHFSVPITSELKYWDLRIFSLRDRVYFISDFGFYQTRAISRISG